MDDPKFRVRTVGDVTVATVGGTDGEPLAPDVGLRGLVDRGARKLVVDTGNMSAVRSWFLGQLVHLQQTTRSVGCQFRVACPDPDLRDVFHITKLNLIMPVYTSLDEALAGF